MSSLSKQHNSNATILTLVTFENSGDLGGEHLGEVMAKAGNDGAKYQDWVNTNGTAKAVFSGSFNQDQQSYMDSIGAKTGATTPESWTHEKASASGTFSPASHETFARCDYD